MAFIEKSWSKPDLQRHRAKDLLACRVGTTIANVKPGEGVHQVTFRLESPERGSIDVSLTNAELDALVAYRDEMAAKYGRKEGS